MSLYMSSSFGDTKDEAANSEKIYSNTLIIKHLR